MRKHRWLLPLAILGFVACNAIPINIPSPSLSADSGSYQPAADAAMGGEITAIDAQGGSPPDAGPDVPIPATDISRDGGAPLDGRTEAAPADLRVDGELPSLSPDAGRDSCGCPVPGK